MHVMYLGPTYSWASSPSVSSPSLSQWPPSDGMLACLSVFKHTVDSVMWWEAWDTYLSESGWFGLKWSPPMPMAWFHFFKSWIIYLSARMCAHHVCMCKREGFLYSWVSTICRRLTLHWRSWPHPGCRIHGHALVCLADVHLFAFLWEGNSENM